MSRWLRHLCKSSGDFGGTNMTLMQLSAGLVLANDFKLQDGQWQGGWWQGFKCDEGPNMLWLRSNVQLFAVARRIAALISQGYYFIQLLSSRLRQISCTTQRRDVPVLLSSLCMIGFWSQKGEHVISRKDFNLFPAPSFAHILPLHVGLESFIWGEIA